MVLERDNEGQMNPRMAVPNRKTTMRDVAALAGVAVKTVSRVVNDEPNVSPAMRAQVVAAIERLGFEKNLMASSVRRSDGRTHSVGLLVPDISNPHWGRLTRKVTDLLQRRRYMLLVGSNDRDAGIEEGLLRAFAARQVDALIIVPSVAGPAGGEWTLTRRIPTIYTDGLPRTPDADAVISDNEGGTRMAVEHLWGFGHRDIAYIGDEQFMSSARERAAGFREAMLERGVIPSPDRFVLDIADQPAARRAAAALLDSAEPPTAIVCGNNTTLLGVLHEVHARGEQETVALIGFDDHEMADVVRPGITVIAQDETALAATIVDRLLLRLSADTAPPGEIVRVPVSLICRGSGEVSPVGARR